MNSDHLDVKPFEAPPSMADATARQNVASAWRWAASTLEEHCGEIGDGAMREFVAWTVIPFLKRKARLAAEDRRIHWWKRSGSKP